MGGLGSGWQTFRTRGGRRTTGSQHSIDIRWLKQNGYLYYRGPGSLSWSSRGEQTGFINYEMGKDSMTFHRPSGSEHFAGNQEALNCQLNVNHVNWSVNQG